jgi:hypothetical protein
MATFEDVLMAVIPDFIAALSRHLWSGRKLEWFRCSGRLHCLEQHVAPPHNMRISETGAPLRPPVHFLEHRLAPLLFPHIARLLAESIAKDLVFGLRDLAAMATWLEHIRDEIIHSLLSKQSAKNDISFPTRMKDVGSDSRKVEKRRVHFILARDRSDRDNSNRLRRFEVDIGEVDQFLAYKKSLHPATLVFPRLPFHRANARCWSKRASGRFPSASPVTVKLSARVIADIQRARQNVCRLVVAGLKSGDEGRRLVAVKASHWINDYLLRPHTGTAAFDPLDRWSENPVALLERSVAPRRDRRSAHPPTFGQWVA